MRTRYHTSPSYEPMTPEESLKIHGILTELRSDLRDVKIALRGDEYGNVGMFKKQADLIEILDRHIEADAVAFKAQSDGTAALGLKVARYGGVFVGLSLAFEAWRAFTGK